MICDNFDRWQLQCGPKAGCHVILWGTHCEALSCNLGIAQSDQDGAQRVGLLCYTGQPFDITDTHGALVRALGAGVDLKSFDIDNKYGTQAMKRILSDMIGLTNPMPDVVVSGRIHPISALIPHSITCEVRCQVQRAIACLMFGWVLLWASC